MSLLHTLNKNESRLLKSTLMKADCTDITWTQDAAGNEFAWVRLSVPDALTSVAQVLQELGVRLCTITAYSDTKDDALHRRSIAYHFVFGATVCTVTVPACNESGEPWDIPSITPWFRNADWNEREFYEMYAIPIKNHPNPRRLFLDERLDAGIMADLIPFSSMVHGASSKDLWEQVMLEKTGATLVKRPEVELQEPEFTPVHDIQED